MNTEYQQKVEELPPLTGRWWPPTASTIPCALPPYRTTENSIKGLVITIIDSLATGRPKREQSGG